MLGRAYQRDTQVCGRVVVGDLHDGRLSLAPGERRYRTVRFLDDVADSFRPLLEELIRRRGDAGRRFAERLEPIDIVLDAPLAGRHHVTGQLEPPTLRYGRLREIEFAIREQPCARA